MAGCRIPGCSDNVAGITSTAKAWLGNGGSTANLINAVAVAGAESSLSDGAISSAGAIGRWQIMPFHAPGYGFRPDDLFDVNVNAYIAVRLSNDGNNWSAWDVAYAAGSDLTSRYYIHDLEYGSEAWKCIDCVLGVLGPGGSALPPGVTQPPSGLPGLPSPEPGIMPPPETPEPPPAPTIQPPRDTIVSEYPHELFPPDYGKWGWEAINRYFGNDLPYYTGYDADLVRILNKLPGSAR